MRTTGTASARHSRVIQISGKGQVAASSLASIEHAGASTADDNAMTHENNAEYPSISAVYSARMLKDIGR